MVKIDEQKEQKIIEMIKRVEMLEDDFRNLR